MMHQLLGRLAQYGGEGALGVLFLLSIVNFAIIGQRIWFFSRRHINASAFVKQLLPLLRARDLPRARALSQQASGSVCAITLAGLQQAEDGIFAVQQTLETAISGERIELEDKLVLLHEVGRLALLLGTLGSLFDILAVGHPSAAIPPPGVVTTPLHYSLLFAAIPPTIGGLLVAISSWLARSMLNVHVQRILRECEFVARLVSSQLAVAEPAPPTPSIQPFKVRRVAV